MVRTALPLALLLSTGCSMSPYEKLNTSEYRSTEAIAAEHFQHEGVTVPPRPASPRSAQTVAYRGANDPLANFSTFPNHTLRITVYAHRNGQGAVIPTYTTAVALYDKPMYALPGEVAAHGR